MLRRRRLRMQEAELDITSFMNLMIILVPVLLMSMVFSHVTVLQLILPDMADSSTPEELQNKKLELVIQTDFMDVNYPAGVRVKRVFKVAKESGGQQVAVPSKEYDYALLSLTLQEIKRQLKDKDVEKRDILILSRADTDYQTIVSTMDTVRSFKTVVVASVVDAELFPNISLGDAPVQERFK